MEESHIGGSSPRFQADTMVMIQSFTRTYVIFTILLLPCSQNGRGVGLLVFERDVDCLTEGWVACYSFEFLSENTNPFQLFQLPIGIIGIIQRQQTGIQHLRI